VPLDLWCPQPVGASVGAARPVEPIAAAMAVFPGIMRGMGAATSICNSTDQDGAPRPFRPSTGTLAFNQTTIPELEEQKRRSTAPLSSSSSRQAKPLSARAKSKEWKIPLRVCMFVCAQLNRVPRRDQRNKLVDTPTSPTPHQTTSQPPLSFSPSPSSLSPRVTGDKERCS
tara:strand:- start:138 stop:650 length:513 start_codon:yes stop_codon:yes gene_type:complete